MAKVLKAVFTRGNDIDYTLDCGHAAFDNVAGSSPAPTQAQLKALEGTEFECFECPDKEDGQ
jgi:hypothetical protein